ncbi:MAG: D-glycerate dehydrogenase [bacterium]|nr:D-glycerate dehydrogenase [bacterium]
MRVYVCRPIPEVGIQILRDAGLEVEVNSENRVLSKEELKQAVKNSEAILSILTDPIDAEVMDAAPNLKIIANFAVGFNNIDVKAATERGILVTNTPGVLDDTTADFAFTLLMAAGRLLVDSDQFTRAGKFDKWEPMGFLGQDIHGATLGIVGAGRIGAAVAKRGMGGFQMKVLYFDPSENEELNKLGAKKVDMDTLLAQSDFVSLHVPLNPSTTHLISAKELKMMKKSAFLINTARGPVVDEQALVDALKAGEIRGAGLDVYEEEPKLKSGLFGLKNVILAPHIASASIQTRGKMATMAAENIVAFATGKKPLTPVNPEVLTPGS